MIDLQLLRTDIASVEKRLATRGFHLDVTRFQDLESKRKTYQTQSQELQAKRNQLAKKIGQLKARGEDPMALLEDSALNNSMLAAAEALIEKAQVELRDFLDGIPNLPHESVPVGAGPEQNLEQRRWGTPRKFDFPVKDHVDVGTGLGLDFATGAKLAGARFAVMKGEIARLHRAIAQFMLDVHTREHGYTEAYVPYMVSADCANGVSSLAKFKGDLFKIEGQELYLIPTAEYPVTNFVREEIVPLESLPQKFVCHSPCFRSEAGAAGKDTRGMIRNHQFDKVELVQIVHPSRSHAGHE